MHKEASFFRQKVNTALALGLIISMCLWTTGYYVQHRAEAFVIDYNQPLSFPQE
jgi:hypothetical protein